MTAVSSDRNRAIAERDPVCSRAVESLDRLVAAAERHGQRSAEGLVRLHGTNDPAALAREEGATIEADDWTGFRDRTVLGEYADGTITVYERQIDAVASRTPLTGERLRSLAIAHELFHHVSDRASPPFQCEVVRRLPTWLPVFGGTTKTTASSALREIAAHAFVTSLVDVHPLSHPQEVFDDRPASGGRPSSESTCPSGTRR